MKIISFRAESIAVALAVLFLTGCSNFTKSGRQQAAYERYVRKSSEGRVTQQKLFHSNRPQMPVTTPAEPTEPQESVGPEAVAENVP